MIRRVKDELPILWGEGILHFQPGTVSPLSEIALTEPLDSPEVGPEQALHLLSRGVKATAVTGQYPLERPIHESLDGTHLLVHARGDAVISLFASP